jgi:hypothetical protein
VNGGAEDGKGTFQNQRFRAGQGGKELVGEMAYELTHPEKIKPYHPENLSLFEREAVKFCRTLFILSLILNLLLRNHNGFVALLRSRDFIGWIDDGLCCYRYNRVVRFDPAVGGEGARWRGFEGR